MKKPEVIALPTSQMAALCDVLELPSSVQDSTESMVEALEAADFAKLTRVESTDGPRPRFGVGFDPAKVDASIIAQRKARMGRT